jgi:superfamily II DNA or RNA helicase
MSVKIVVGNVYSRILGQIPDSTMFSIRSELSYKLKDAFFILQTRSDDTWDGVVHLYWPDRGHSFYTGMMSDVLSILEASRIEYSIDDRRVVPEINLPHLELSQREDMETRPYQNYAVECSLKATRGIIQAATGSGKTYIITKLIASIKTAPFIFYVLSMDLLDQAYECLSENLNVPIGRVGAGHADIQDINVVMIQTAIKAINRTNDKFDVSKYSYDEEDDWSDDTLEKSGRADAIEAMVRGAKGIYLDECHHAASRTSKEIVEASRDAYWKFGGSATPFREDGAEKMIKSLFGRNLVKISASWLIRNKYLVKPYIFNIVIDDDKPMSAKTYQKVYSQHISKNASFHDIVAMIMNHLKFLKIPTLTLVQHYNHGDAIIARCPEAPFIKGKLSRTKRRGLINDLRDGTIDYAVATTLADEGLDVKPLGAALVPGGGKSITRVYQRVGRTLRTFDGKEVALVFLFHHKCKYLDSHGVRVKNILKDEPEFVLIESSPGRILDDIDDIVRPQAGLFDD